MESIIGALGGSQEFLRIRLGIAPDKPVRDGASYVLSQLKKSQMPLVDEMLEAASEAVKVILSDGPDAAMNRFNRKPDGPTEGGVV
jgi:PTH1 family peptidyl-tRNA hydrolase